MQPLPVQFAGATAGTPPVAIGLAGTASADDSFASAFGEALADAPDYVSNGSPIAPKTQNEQSNAGNSDAASMAVTFLNCFVANLVQATPTAVPGGEAGTTQSNSAAPTTAPTSASPPQADASPSSPAVLTGAISVAPVGLSDRQSAATVASLPKVGAELSSPTVTTGSGINIRTSRGDDQISADPASPNQADVGVSSSTVATGAGASAQAASHDAKSAAATSRDVHSAAATLLPPEMDKGVAGPAATTGTDAGAPATLRAGESAAAPVTFAPTPHQGTQKTADASLPGDDRTTRFVAGHTWTTSKTEATRSRKDTVAAFAGSGETTAQSGGFVAAQASPPVPAPRR